MPASSNELSDRELEILNLVATGASNKEIARQLYISANTVKVHLRNIFSKIGASSRTEAAMYAVSSGLVPGVLDSNSTGINNDKAVWQIGNLKLQRNTTTWTIGFIIIGVFGVIGLATFLALRSIEVTTLETPPEGASSRWQILSPMPTARFGLATAAYENHIYAIGGKSELEVTGIVECYDPASDSWTQLSPKPTPVYEVHAVVIGGNIFIPGGRLASRDVTDVLEIYDPRQDAWKEGATLPVAISAYALAVFEGRMYLFGGWDGSEYQASVYAYDPEVDAWIDLPPMSAPRGYSGAAVASRRIFVIGGYDGQKALSINEAFEPDLAKNRGQPWSAGEPLPEGMHGMGVDSIADIIYVIGGASESDRRYPALAFFHQANEWRAIEAQANDPETNPSLTGLGEHIYAIGGRIREAPSNNNLAYQAIYTLSFPIIIK